MNITVRNLTQAQLSTDLGLILPGQSVSVDLSPDEAYRASEGLRGFVAAGRCTVTVAAEPDLASDVGMATTTTAAINLYVEASGSDISGDGTQARPFATIQKAVDSVPKIIRHPVTVNATSTISDNTGFGINLAYSGGYPQINSHSSIRVATTLTMANNVAGDLSIDGATATAIADLRLDADKTIVDLVRFNRMAAD